jgi:Family of unknown function (DUF6282)
VEVEDVLLQGALDLHAHGHPEFTARRRPRVSNVEWARLAAAAGMRGFVMKSHVWPTVQVAAMLAGLSPELEVFGSITLNPPVGGLSPTAVEFAGQMGAKVVWMPTWSARHVPPKSSITLERMRPLMSTLDPDRARDQDAISILADDGSLRPVVGEILAVCRAYDLTVASGHLPPAASVVLAGAAREAGVRFVLTHACSGSVDASIEQQQEIASLGGFIEHVFISCMPMHQRGDPRKIAAAVEAVGPEHCVLASDAGEAWNPPAPEVLRMFIASMLALGLSEDAVHLMTHENPARALGLPEQPGSAT